MDVLLQGMAGRAEGFPGGEAMAKLVVGKARQVMSQRSEEEVRGYVDLLGRLSHAVLTGEGFEELMRGKPDS